MRLSKKIAPVLFSLSLFFLSACEKETIETKKEIKAEEWIMSVDETEDKLNELIKSTQDVYTLYVIGKMSPDDFLVELEVQQNMLFSIQKNYTDKKSDLVIEPESSEDAKKGIASFEDLFEDINGLYVASVNQIGTPYSAAEVSFIYLNYKDKIIDDYAVYSAAVILSKNSDSGEVTADNSAEK